MYRKPSSKAIKITAVSFIVIIGIIDIMFFSTNKVECSYDVIKSRVTTVAMFDATKEFNPLKDNLFAMYRDDYGNVLYYRIVAAFDPTEIGIMLTESSGKIVKVYYGIDLLSNILYAYDDELREIYIGKDGFNDHMVHDELIRCLTSLIEVNNDLKLNSR